MGPPGLSMLPRTPIALRAVCDLLLPLQPYPCLADITSYQLSTWAASYQLSAWAPLSLGSLLWPWLPGSSPCLTFPQALDPWPWSCLSWAVGPWPRSCLSLALGPWLWSHLSWAVGPLPHLIPLRLWASGPDFTSPSCGPLATVSPL